MDQEEPARVTSESVVSILSSFTDQGTTDRGSINQLVVHAKKQVQDYAKGSFLPGRSLRVDKILYALMDHAIDGHGQHYVATAILACREYEDDTGRTEFLVKLAEVWLTQLIFPVKTAGAKRKGSASPEQTPRYDETASLIESASRGNQKALRIMLRRRQGEKCAISGYYGIDAPLEVVGNGLQTVLNASHILPFSLNEFDDRDSISIKQAAITWDMLARWTSFDLTKLAGMKINGPANALLLRSDLDVLFGRFHLWLESTDKPHTYKVASLYNMGYKDNVISFVNQGDELIDLPDPEILAMHAAFAHVLYATGAGEYIERFWHDRDKFRVLSAAGDGNDHFLSMAFQKLIVV